MVAKFPLYETVYLLINGRMHRFVFVQQPLIGFTFCPKLHIIKFFFNLDFVESLEEICVTQTTNKQQQKDDYPC